MTAKGGEKQYDGKPLTAAETGYAIGGEGLVEGHEADVAHLRIYPYFYHFFMTIFLLYFP